MKAWRSVLVLGAPRAPRILLTSTVFVLCNWLKDWATIFTHSPKNINYRVREGKRHHHFAASCTYECLSRTGDNMPVPLPYNTSNWLHKLNWWLINMLLRKIVYNIWYNLMPFTRHNGHAGSNLFVVTDEVSLIHCWITSLSFCIPSRENLVEKDKISWKNSHVGKTGLSFG